MGSGSKLIFMTLGCAVNNFRSRRGLGWVGSEREGGHGGWVQELIMTCSSMVTNGSTALIFMYWIQ